MDAAGIRQRDGRPAHNCVSLDQLCPGGMPGEDYGREIWKHRAVGQSSHQGVNHLERTDRNWRGSGSAGIPGGAPPAQDIRRRTVHIHIFLIQELGSDEDRLACGWASDPGSFQRRPVIGFDVSPLPVNNNKRTRDLRLRFGPVEGDKKGIGGGTRSGGYAESLSGNGCGRRLSLQARLSPQSPGKAPRP